MGYAECEQADHRSILHSNIAAKRESFNIQHSTFNIIKAYEKEFLGSRDSHSDSGADGGSDRTGNDELHGVWSVLRTEMRNEK